MGIRLWIWRSGLLLLAGLAAWAAIGSGLGAHFAKRLGDGDGDVLPLLRSWQPGHPEGLLREGAQLPVDSTQSALLLEKAYRLDPSDARSLLFLARRAELQGELERSDAFIALATELAPAMASVHTQAAAYWARRRQYSRMVTHLVRALEADADARSELFPVLLQVAETPDLRHLLEPLGSAPPSWWNAFFPRASRKLRDLEALRFLYGTRRDSPKDPFSDAERTAYVERLLREGLTGEAYLIWVSGLGKAERSQLGLLFNGGFELPLAEQGFGWRIAKSKHFSARLGATYGMTGSRALQVRFRRHTRRFRHVSQRLYLDAGVYRLRGRARPDGLRSKGGLRWAVHCVAPEATVLGEGPRLLGAAEWTRFEMRFEVPGQCEQQLLRLESAGERRFEWPVDGEIWFDVLEIVRSPELDVKARADAISRAKTSTHGGPSYEERAP